jgi:2-polyprenyl-3-methyl-5-hydroxy-6-metoxy-1,4-benzoquinol methylase
MKLLQKIALRFVSNQIAEDLLQNFIGKLPTPDEVEAAADDLKLSLSTSQTLVALLEKPENRAKVHRLFANDIVDALYRVALKRDPDPVGFESHIRQFSQHGKVEEVINGFINSPEFRQKHRGSIPFMHQSMPSMTNDYDKASSEQLQLISDKIKKSWEHLGITRAHHSVLTSKDFLPDSLEKNIDAFWKSGDKEVKEIEAILKRHGMKLNEVNVAVEYGCGVGRVTTQLAKQVKAMYAYDISRPHLDYAKEHAEEEGVDIKFHLVSDPLGKLHPCDLFYSRIVFQHNPPPIILQLIKNAMEALNPRGIAIFQVPSYIKGYEFKLEEWMKKDHALDMQMHCIPQTAIFTLAETTGCKLLEIREDNWCGEPERYLSNTFVVTKNTL